MSFKAFPFKYKRNLETYKLKKTKFRIKYDDNTVGHNKTMEKKIL